MRLKKLLNWIMGLEVAVLVTILGAFFTVIYYTIIGIVWMIASVKRAEATEMALHQHLEQVAEDKAIYDGRMNALSSDVAEIKGMAKLILQLQRQNNNHKEP